MNVGTLTVMLTANTTGLANGMKSIYRMEQAMMATSGSMNKSIAATNAAVISVGKNLTQYVTLPLSLIGIVAVKSFMEFEYGLAKVQGLIQISGERVQSYGAEILKFGSSVGKSATELSKALYMVATSGMRGADVMDVLRLSTKGSVAGLGDISQVVDITTSAMNAYGKETLSAARALDIVTATVREGKAEASALVSAMGVATPIASKLGVTFDQVGAAMAAMTRTGTKTSTSATQTRQMLFNLIKPAAMSKKAIAEMGSSFEELRMILREKGLMAMLQKVNEITDGSTVGMASLFRNVRALNGVTDLLGEHMEENLALFDRIANSSGNLDRAFAAVAETTKVKLDKAMARWNALMIQLGETLAKMFIPIINAVTTAMEWMANAFGWLPEPVRDFIHTLTAIVVIGAPLLLLIKGLSAAFGAMALMSTGLAASMGYIVVAGKSISVAFGVITIAVVALYAAYKLISWVVTDVSDAHKYMKDAVENANNSIIAEKQNIQSLLQILNSSVVSTNDKAEALDRLKLVSEKYFGALEIETLNTEKATEAADKYLKSLHDISAAKEFAQARAKIDAEVLAEVAKPKREVGWNAQWDLTLKYFDKLKLKRMEAERITYKDKYRMPEVNAIRNATGKEYLDTQLAQIRALTTANSSANNFMKGFTHTKSVQQELKAAIKILTELQSDAPKLEAEYIGTVIDAYKSNLEVFNNQLAKISSNKSIMFPDIGIMTAEDEQALQDFQDDLDNVSIMAGYLGKQFDTAGTSIAIMMKQLDSDLYSDETKTQIGAKIQALQAEQEATEKATKAWEDHKKAYKEAKDSDTFTVQMNEAIAEGTLRMEEYAKSIKNIKTEFAKTFDFIDSLHLPDEKTVEISTGSYPELKRQLADAQKAQDMSLTPEVYASTGKQIDALTEKIKIFKGEVGLTDRQLVQMWKAMSRGVDALSSIFTDLGAILGESFTKAVKPIVQTLNLIGSVFSLVENITKLMEIFNGVTAIGTSMKIVDTMATTANTTAKTANTAVAAAGIPVVLGAAAAQGVLADANAVVAVTGAAASTSWLPIVGPALAIAGMIAVMAVMASQKSKATGMANGGIVPSGYNNDTFPAMLSSNEAVIPLSNLPQMLNGFNSKKDKKQRVEFIIEGRVLRGILQDANTVSKAF